MNGWDGIEEFVAVATAGNFNRAAESLVTSPSNVSRAIAALEKRIQAQLFFRTTRKVTLTERGKIFLDHCRQMLDQRDESLALVSELGELAGEVKMTCPAAMGVRFITPITLKFCASHPNVTINLEATNRIVDLVAEGFDLAVRTGSLESSRLIGARIGFRRLVTCASPAYLDRAGRPEEISDLMRHDCLVGIAGSWTYGDKGSEHTFRPKGRWRCNDGDAVLAAALAGMGICQLPEYYLRHYIKSGQLEEILSKFEPKKEPVWLVHPHRKRVPTNVRTLMDHLKTELPKAMID